MRWLSLRVSFFSPYLLEDFAGHVADMPVFTKAALVGVQVSGTIPLQANETGHGGRLAPVSLLAKAFLASSVSLAGNNSSLADEQTASGCFGAV